jgi:hypothetical protein
MTRAEFIRQQRIKLDKLFGFAPSENELCKLFERLALETFDHFAAIKAAIYPINPIPQSAQLTIDHWTRLYTPMPTDLQARWQAWQADWPGLLARNPKLELYLAIQALSYSFLQRSWPDGFEGRLQDWVDSGKHLPIRLDPLRDEHGVVTPELFQRLCELRQRCDGWFYTAQDGMSYSGVTFVPEPFCSQMAKAHRSSYGHFIEVWNDFAEILDREQPLYR